LKIVYGILKSSLYDYVIWLDSDAAFVDHKISIKELIFLYPGYDLMISKDPPLYECRSLCAGVFIVKYSKWSKYFLLSWYISHKKQFTAYAHKHPWEQAAFNEMRQHEKHAPHIKILPYCYLNGNSLDNEKGLRPFISHQLYPLKYTEPNYFKDMLATLEEK